MKFLKQILTITIASFLAVSAFAQTNPSQSEKWKLNKYLWGYAQENKILNSKFPIDFSAIDNWQGMSDYLAVSNDGKYFAYGIESGGGHPYDLKKKDSLIVQSTHNEGWKYAVAGKHTGFFSINNREYILQHQDSLIFLQLGKQNHKVISNVRLYLATENNRWIAYELKTTDNQVALLDMLTGNTRQIPNVKRYSFDKSNKWLVCETTNPSKGLMIYNLERGSEQIFPVVESYTFSIGGAGLLLNTGNELQYINTHDQSNYTIYKIHDSAEKISACQFDPSEKQVIFAVNKGLDIKALNSIWYYKEGMPEAIIKINQQAFKFIPDATIESAAFTDNGHYISLWLMQHSALPEPAINVAQLDVWSYKDHYNQIKQSDASLQKRYNAVIGLEGGLVKWWSNEGEELVDLKGNYAVVKKSTTNKFGDRFWENVNEDSIWILSLQNGNRYLLPVLSTRLQCWFSPQGRYLVYFDASHSYHYFSFDLRTGIITDISFGITKGQFGNVDRFVRTDNKPIRHCGLAGWVENDAGLLVYDNNDIWYLNLAGDVPAINLTNGYGKKLGIIFNLIGSSRYGNDDLAIVKANQPLLLRAFQTLKKYSGFYTTKGNVVGDPELVSMGPYFTHLINECQDPNISNRGMHPQKASNNDTWIVQRQSINDAPNYFVTKDFKTFKRLTNLQPHLKYKWLREELCSYKHLDGTTGQGILYKPEDFDSSKKYPVLIVFYGGFSNNMFQYPLPSYIYSAETPGLSPVWFMNNGYLVFTPDIYIYPRKIGPGAYNVIDGAAAYLKSLPFVDVNGIGCASHSFSGKLGAYLFTHSKAFRAMAISEGYLYANMTNVALSGGGLEGVENTFHFGNLYENKASWIDHTTVLNTDKAVSPLLLFCNKLSSQVYQDQTIQFYSSLQRQDKKVWWLKYDKGFHILADLEEQKDYTIRYTQYFDHYLKKAPAPRWMTEGVPNALRGVEARFELDAAGSCGLKDNCVICHAWNQQYKRNPAMFEKPISEWSLDKDIQQELNNKIAAERKKLDADGAIETKRILDIVKNGYPDTRKAVKK